MSFYCSKNANAPQCPGTVSPDSSCRFTERVCIQVKKVYDACMQQEQLDNVRVELHIICPSNPVPPFSFVSCRSTGFHGDLRAVRVDRLADSTLSRVRALVDIPIEVLFTDANDNEFVGQTCVTVAKDVVMFVPDESVIPYFIDNIVSAICVSGVHCECNRFVITVCVTVILKVVAEVDLLIPAFGFCNIPPCEQFAENVCDEFFSLPIFPPQPATSTITSCPT